MKRKPMKFLMAWGLILSLGLISFGIVTAQNSNSSATGEMKQSGSEVGNAGKSMGRNVRHGRVVRGGKHFGKHIGRAGKHFGKGTKRGTKKVFKRIVS